MPTIDIDRDSAREAAEQELAKPSYPRPPLEQRVIHLIESLVRQSAVKASMVPGGWLTISLLLIGLAIAFAAAVRIGHRTVRTNRGGHRLFGSVERSAADHRATAEHCAETGDWARAIRHRLRAVARELEHTGVLDPIPGRTVNELATDAGAALPQLAVEFDRAAIIFNDVSYGNLPATSAGYRSIAELDDRLRSAAHPARSG